MGRQLIKALNDAEQHIPQRLWSGEAYSNMQATNQTSDLLSYFRPSLLVFEARASGGFLR